MNKPITTHEEIDALNTSEAHKAILHHRLDVYNELHPIQKTGIMGVDDAPQSAPPAIRGGEGLPQIGELTPAIQG